MAAEPRHRAGTLAALQESLTAATRGDGWPASRWSCGPARRAPNFMVYEALDTRGQPVGWKATLRPW
jgi:hypothetical protein